MKKSLVDWDKKKHGLIWKTENVFTDDEVEYIISKIQNQRVTVPEKYRPTAYNANHLPMINESWGDKLIDLYFEIVKEYRKEGIELYCDEQLRYKRKNNQGEIIDMVTSKPKLLKPEDLEPKFHLQGTIQGLNYPVHPDIPAKLMTFLVYIHPEKQEPTYFHEYDRNLMQRPKEEDKNPVKYIDWKVNNGYVFLPNKFSFHSYTNTIYPTERYVVLGQLRRKNDAT